MKTIIVFIALASLFVLCPQFANAQGGISIGIREHVTHTVFEDLPFADGDLTYTIGYEYHDKNGYWQFMLGYTPEVGKGAPGADEEAGDDVAIVDYVITPQINLIIQDGIFLAGTGILGSYIETEEDSDWTDIYWQLLLGLEIPMGAVRLEVLAYYPFERWGDIGDFDFDDVEYGGSLKYLF